jgi:hypothetical protein
VEAGEVPAVKPRRLKWAVGLQRKSGQGRDAYAGGDEGLHDDHVVAGGCDAWRESFLPTHGDQLVPAPLATADPGGVAMVRDAVVGSLDHEVDRVVGDVDQAKSFFLYRVVGVAVAECDVDLAVSQRPLIHADV